MNDPRNQYPYGYPYPYGNPNAGVYYPNQNNPNSSSSSSSSPTNSPTTPATDKPGSLFDQGNGSGASAPPSNPRTMTPTTAPAPDPELASATAEYNAAMDHLKETLKSEPAYKVALADKKTAQDEVAALRDKGDDTLAAAQRSLDAGKKLSAIEKEAMTKDPRVIAARTRLDAAIAAHNAAK